MARIVKEHTVRRNEILDVAQQLVITRGYEQMSIQDILNELQIAKGTLYHYFDSKQALLEALLERMMDEVEQTLLPLVNDSKLASLDKFQRFFATLNHYRTEQKPFVLEVWRAWYADGNALVRQKARATLLKRVKPLLTVVISQGVQEGVLTTSYPEHVSDVILSLHQGLEETLASWFFSDDPAKRADLHQLENIVATYVDALERIVGAPRDSLHPIDIDLLKAWSASENADA